MMFELFVIALGTAVINLNLMHQQTGTILTLFEDVSDLSRGRPTRAMREYRALR